MKWVLFTGTWRLTSEEVEHDVRKAVRDVLARGDGVLTGGATGVDYFAMDESLKHNPTASHLRVIIPARLENYIDDYFTNWFHHPITQKDIENLAELLRKIKGISPTSIMEMPYTIITQEHYNLHNTEEVRYADEVHAFQVNDSTGTQDTIDKAIKADLPIAFHKKYTI